jgi:hypothetical protein
MLELSKPFKTGFMLSLGALLAYLALQAAQLGVTLLIGWIFSYGM